MLVDAYRMRKIWASREWSPRGENRKCKGLGQESVA